LRKLALKKRHPFAKQVNAHVAEEKEWNYFFSYYFTSIFEMAKPFMKLHSKGGKWKKKCGRIMCW